MKILDSVNFTEVAGEMSKQNIINNENKDKT